MAKNNLFRLSLAQLDFEQCSRLTQAIPRWLARHQCSRHVND